jgi:hypothetical protein
MPLRTMAKMDPAKVRAMRDAAATFLDGLAAGAEPAPSARQGALALVPPE